MKLWEFKMEIRQAEAEIADSVLLEQELEGWNVFEEVIIQQAWVQGVFEDRQLGEHSWSQLKTILEGQGLHFIGELSVRCLEDQDWKDSYKAHFKASKFGRLHWVPEWERATHVLPAGDVVLWLDPGLAFGTGNHETTRLCCERLVTWAVSKNEQELKTLRLIDAGCGSGILALSAALLGFARIEGFDNDPEAVRISGENAALNQLQGRVHFFVGDLISGLAGKQADFMMANIQADVLMRFSDHLLETVAPGGRLVLSGILAQERDKVRDHFAGKAKGWDVESRLMGEWSDVMLQRPA